jgi:hypothetical protein
MISKAKDTLGTKHDMSIKKPSSMTPPPAYAMAFPSCQTKATALQ